MKWESLILGNIIKYDMSNKAEIDLCNQNKVFYLFNDNKMLESGDWSSGMILV